jgi:hypothetical protein
VRLSVPAPVANAPVARVVYWRRPLIPPLVAFLGRRHPKPGGMLCVFAGPGWDSVDSWPLAISRSNHPGGRLVPRSAPTAACVRRSAPSFWRAHAAVVAPGLGAGALRSVRGRSSENNSGGNRMSLGGSTVRRRCPPRTDHWRLVATIPTYWLNSFPLRREVAAGQPRILTCPRCPGPASESYLVDSASSHMLVSKIKPCMSKYKQSVR